MNLESASESRHFYGAAPPSKPPMLVGIAGPKGSGKTTIARRLEKRGYRHVAFAGPIKRMLVGLYGHRIETEDRKELPIAHGVSTRQLMQSLGDWGRSIHPDFWVACMAENIKFVRQFAGNDVRFCIADVRYDNEADWIRQRHGVILRITGTCSYSGEHSSETGLTPHPRDVLLNPAAYWDNEHALDGILTAVVGGCPYAHAS